MRQRGNNERKEHTPYHSGGYKDQAGPKFLTKYLSSTKGMIEPVSSWGCARTHCKNPSKYSENISKCEGQEIKRKGLEIAFVCDLEILTTW